jgi:hypothetical protein
MESIDFLSSHRRECAGILQSVVFESYHIQGGTDRTGVPTRMMSVNATVRLRFRNRGTFFGLHVSATPFHLFFDDLTVASGNVCAPPSPPSHHHRIFAFASTITISQLAALNCFLPGLAFRMRSVSVTTTTTPCPRLIRL